jgi:hypothetical protein
MYDVSPGFWLKAIKEKVAVHTVIIAAILKGEASP